MWGVQGSTDLNKNLIRVMGVGEAGKQSSSWKWDKERSKMNQRYWNGRWAKKIQRTHNRSC